MYIVHRDDKIYGAYTSEEDAYEKQHLVRVNLGLDGYNDTRVFVTEVNLDENLST